MKIVQVAMMDVLFTRFKEWLDREVDAEVFLIPGQDDESEEIPTYAVSPRMLPR